MLLLLASVFCNKIGVLLLLLAYLEQNNEEQIYNYKSRCHVPLLQTSLYTCKLVVWQVSLSDSLKSTYLVKLLLNFTLLFCN